jgi:hypothetical protein
LVTPKDLFGVRLIRTSRPCIAPSFESSPQIVTLIQLLLLLGSGLLPVSGLLLGSWLLLGSGLLLTGLLPPSGLLLLTGEPLLAGLRAQRPIHLTGRMDGLGLDRLLLQPALDLDLLSDHAFDHLIVDIELVGHAVHDEHIVVTDLIDGACEGLNHLIIFPGPLLDSRLLWIPGLLLLAPAHSEAVHRKSKNDKNDIHSNTLFHTSSMVFLCRENVHLLSVAGWHCPMIKNFLFLLTSTDVFAFSFTEKTIDSFSHKKRSTQQEFFFFQRTVEKENLFCLVKVKIL